MSKPRVNVKLLSGVNPDNGRGLFKANTYNVVVPGLASNLNYTTVHFETLKKQIDDVFNQKFAEFKTIFNKLQQERDNALNRVTQLQTQYNASQQQHVSQSPRDQKMTDAEPERKLEAVGAELGGARANFIQSQQTVTAIANKTQELKDQWNAEKTKLEGELQESKTVISKAYTIFMEILKRMDNTFQPPQDITFEALVALLNQKFNKSTNETNQAKEAYTKLVDAGTKIQTELNKCIADYAQQTEEFKRCNTSLSECQTNLGQLNNDNTAGNQKVKQLEERIATHKTELSSLQSQIGQLTQLKNENDARILQQQKDVEVKLAESLSEIKTLNEEKAITATAYSKCLKDQNSLKAELDIAKRTNAEVQTKLEEALQKHSNANTAIAELQKQAVERDAELEKLKLDQASKISELVSIRDNALQTQKVECETKITNIQSEQRQTFIDNTTELTRQLLDGSEKNATLKELIGIINNAHSQALGSLTRDRDTQKQTVSRLATDRGYVFDWFKSVLPQLFSRVSKLQGKQYTDADLETEAERFISAWDDDVKQGLAYFSTMIQTALTFLESASALNESLKTQLNATQKSETALHTDIEKLANENKQITSEVSKLTANLSVLQASRELSEKRDADFIVWLNNTFGLQPPLKAGDNKTLTVTLTKIAQDLQQRDNEFRQWAHATFDFPLTPDESTASIQYEISNVVSSYAERIDRLKLSLRDISQVVSELLHKDANAIYDLLSNKTGKNTQKDVLQELVDLFAKKSTKRTSDTINIPVVEEQTDEMDSSSIPEEKSKSKKLNTYTVKHTKREQLPEKTANQLVSWFESEIVPKLTEWDGPPDTNLFKISIPHAQDISAEFADKVEHIRKSDKLRDNNISLSSHITKLIRKLYFSKVDKIKIQQLEDEIKKKITDILTYNHKVWAARKVSRKPQVVCLSLTLKPKHIKK